MPLASPSGFYVDPDSPAARQRQQWAGQGRTEDARRIGELAAQPLPDWLTAPTGKVGAEVTGYVGRAAAVNQVPLLVAYYVPGRDCSSYSGGGAADAGDYRAWIREVASALKGRAATVVLEPDAVPHEVSGCGQGLDRPALLSDAVQVLKAAGPVTVYLDAGNPGFVTDTGALAQALKDSGVQKADGFSLNVANFYPTPEVLDFGRRVSAALGGTHFVVDTSRNGNGRPDGDTIDGGPSFCNPPGRAIGQLPTTKTGDEAVDAFLWIKRVGESDGACRPGEPEAGQWWPEYALGLVPS
jgi:endoglucanase